jgi:hypothetical protein
MLADVASDLRRFTQSRGAAWFVTTRQQHRTAECPPSKEKRLFLHRELRERLHWLHLAGVSWYPTHIDRTSFAHILQVTHRALKLPHLISCREEHGGRMASPNIPGNVEMSGLDSEESQIPAPKPIEEKLQKQLDKILIWRRTAHRAKDQGLLE